MTPDAKTRAAMVEAMAEALFLADEMVQFRKAFPWADQSEAFKDRYRKSACSALPAAILEAQARGFKLVGPEATEEMLLAMEAAPCGDPDGGETGVFWGPMWTDAHTAAPGWENGT